MDFKSLNSMVRIFGGGVPDLRTDWVIACCFRHNVELGLAMIGDSMKKKGLELRNNVIFFNSLIDGLCRSDRVDDALKLFERMPKLGSLPNSHTWVALIRGLCCKKDGSHFALQLLHDGIQFSRDRCDVSAACNVVLEDLGKRGSWEPALNLFQVMIEWGVVPDYTTYYFLVKCCCRAGQVDVGLELFNHMVETNYAPNRGMMTALIHALIANNRLAEARHHYDRMIELKLFPTVFTSNTLIRGFCHTGETDSAMELYRSMPKPNLVTYNTLIDHLCKYEGGVGGEKVSEVMSILDEMMGNGHTPNAITYNVLIHEYCRKGMMGSALSMFKSIKFNGIKPTVYTYNILIHGYLKLNLAENAKLVFHYMVDLGFEVPPNAVTYTLFIDFYSKKRLFDEATRYWNLMTINGVQPSSVTYTCLIHGYCSAGFVHEALTLFHGMIYEGGLQPDRAIVSALIKAHRRR